jgi:hypothetical protein
MIVELCFEMAFQEVVGQTNGMTEALNGTAHVAGILKILETC